MLRCILRLFQRSANPQTLYEVLLTIHTTHVEAERAFNACELTLVSFTRLHSRYMACAQWRSGPKCRPEPTAKLPPFPSLQFAYNNLK